MIEEAAAFAAQAHHGTFRKGTQIPYITHPMEAAVIVSGFTDDPEMIAAALLHDVVEDTGVTEEEIRERFGSRVACLVANETEDKTKSWRERKGATIQHLQSAPREIKILDEIWQRFNEKDKAMHAWYYWGIADALDDLKEHLYYKEYIMLCRTVFGAGT